MTQSQNNPMNITSSNHLMASTTIDSDQRQSGAFTSMQRQNKTMLNQSSSQNFTEGESEGAHRLTGMSHHNLTNNTAFITNVSVMDQ